MKIYKVISVISFLAIFILFPKEIFADTSVYRSAGWVGTDGDPAYSSLSNCQVNDGQYCSRVSASSYGNIYFGSFGTLSDFGIPHGAALTKVHIKIKGKSSDILKLGVDTGKNKIPITNNCQSPFDLWWFALGVIDTTKEYHTSFTVYPPGNNLGSCFIPSIVDQERFTFRINQALTYSWSADIDNFEVAFDYLPAPTPTPTATHTPTPSPTAIPTPEPFLDLPWDYEGKGMDFTTAALAINSYFDHEYPLLSSGLGEPMDAKNTLVTFLGFPRKSTTDKVWYSLHDGYDYAKRGQVNINDSVLAAAAGEATYVNTCGACGNAIHIDHKNGYQTRYYHLQKEGLIVTNPVQKVQVSAGQTIGKVGFTGNVDPQGEGGAHIHFMVVEDKNHDGNFEDNIPDGVTDPFGWQSLEPDPWEHYSFFYNGQQRTGNKSYYLWKKKIAGLKENLPANGGVFQVGKTTVTFPADATRPDLNLEIQSSHWVKLSESIIGIGPSFEIVAKNSLGDIIKIFTEPFMLKIDFGGFDLSRYDLETTAFAIYSSEDGVHWTKEPTVIDLSEKIATAEVNHLTQFALMAERRDTTAPVTVAQLQGEQGQPNLYRSDVKVELNAQDNEGGLGVDYTLYKVGDEDWQIYTAPVHVTTEGRHAISFYSVDNDENIEEVKTVSLVIDKTAPEGYIEYDLNKFDIVVSGSDSAGLTEVIIDKLSTINHRFTVRDQAGNTLRIMADKMKLGKQIGFTVKNLQYNSNPFIPIEKNIFFTLAFTDQHNNVKQLDQYYSLKDDKKIFTNYASSRNTTKIYTRVSGSTDYTVETRLGIVLLKLSTQNGTLKYSY